MKILLDSCVWDGVKQSLEKDDHDVIWCGEWDRDPGDREILSYSLKENRVLVTLDKDFGELAIVHGHPHCGIIRLVNLSIQHQASVSRFIFSHYRKEIEPGAILTVEKDRVRIRPPASSDQ